jgi:hypothetical protein
MTLDTLLPVYESVPINVGVISASLLNIEDKSRSNPLGWKGQFSPQLIDTLLREYASSDSIVFDPFVGSGTVLLEAGRKGLQAYGAEINPAAVALSQTYRYINLSGGERNNYLQKGYRKLSEGLSDPALIFRTQHGEADNEVIQSNLLSLLANSQNRWESILLEALIVLLDYWKEDLTHKTVFTKWNRLQSHIEKLPYSPRPVELFHADARQTPLKDQSVNLVLTSPPYINVFNYHQQYRASVEALHWDVLAIAKSEIGSNRKHRGNRFLTVIQYCLDMAQVFKELSRVCELTGRIIFIVGRESRVQGVAFNNGEIVAEVAAHALGFNLIFRQERHFTNRFGQEIYEDILHFQPPNVLTASGYQDHAREIAGMILGRVCHNAPSETQAAIMDAIKNLDAVSPSDVFNYTNHLTVHP